ncbi:hypothetical protein K439DRAFT_1614621 [Ramaria rubella]|nr:hypothetical protein K439DRAFT_1614621 [Ramaria rubella]
MPPPKLPGLPPKLCPAPQPNFAGSTPVIPPAVATTALATPVPSSSTFSMPRAGLAPLPAPVPPLVSQFDTLFEGAAFTAKIYQADKGMQVVQATVMGLLALPELSSPKTFDNIITHMRDLGLYVEDNPWDFPEDVSMGWLNAWVVAVITFVKCNLLLKPGVGHKPSFAGWYKELSVLEIWKEHNASLKWFFKMAAELVTK